MRVRMDQCSRSDPCQATEVDKNQRDAASYSYALDPVQGRAGPRPGRLRSFHQRPLSVSCCRKALLRPRLYIEKACELFPMTGQRLDRAHGSNRTVCLEYA